MNTHEIDNNINKARNHYLNLKAEQERQETEQKQLQEIRDNECRKALLKLLSEEYAWPDWIVDAVDTSVIHGMPSVYVLYLAFDTVAPIRFSAKLYMNNEWKLIADTGRTHLTVPDSAEITDEYNDQEQTYWRYRGGPEYHYRATDVYLAIGHAAEIYGEELPNAWERWLIELARRTRINKEKTEKNRLERLVEAVERLAEANTTY